MRHPLNPTNQPVDHSFSAQIFSPLRGVPLIELRYHERDDTLVLIWKPSEEEAFRPKTSIETACRLMSNLRAVIAGKIDKPAVYNRYTRKTTPAEYVQGWEPRDLDLEDLLKEVNWSAKRPAAVKRRQR